MHFSHYLHYWNFVCWSKSKNKELYFSPPPSHGTYIATFLFLLCSAFLSFPQFFHVLQRSYIKKLFIKDESEKIIIVTRLHAPMWAYTEKDKMCPYTIVRTSHLFSTHFSKTKSPRDGPASAVHRMKENRAQRCHIIVVFTPWNQCFNYLMFTRDFH